VPFSTIPRHAQLPRLYTEQPPEHTYYYVAYRPESGYRIVEHRVTWETSRGWDAPLTGLARVARRPEFACWLDSAAGDAFLSDHHWAPLLVDGVLAAAPPLLSRF
jgi:hypothetical protein